MGWDRRRRRGVVKGCGEMEEEVYVLCIIGAFWHFRRMAGREIEGCPCGSCVVARHGNGRRIVVIEDIALDCGIHIQERQIEDV